MLPVTTDRSVLDLALELVPDVSVRPEPFGALLYSFGTRRLSFLKDRQLLAVVQRLSAAPTARAACADVGVAPEELRSYDLALLRLTDSGMLRERAA